METQVATKPRSRGARSRRSRTSGAEVVEFSLILLPLLMITGVLVDTAWAVFAESTLQRAVRVGVRSGVTLTGAQMASGGNLTDTVKATVQANAAGLLKGSTGLAKVKVHYWLPPPPTSSSLATEVSSQPNGNAPGNIMQVSVEGFSLVPLMVRIFMKSAPDNNPLIINVTAADVIEPNRNPPPIGPAP